MQAAVIFSSAVNDHFVGKGSGLKQALAPVVIPHSPGSPDRNCSGKLSFISVGDGFPVPHQPHGEFAIMP